MSTFVLNPKSVACLAVTLVLALSGRVCAQTGPIKGNLHVVAIGVNNAIGQPPLQSPSRNAEAQVRFWAAQGGKLYNQVDVAPALTNERATCQAILASSPDVLALGKAAFYDQLSCDEATAYKRAVEIITDNATRADAQEGISAFLEKRPPVWGQPS